MFKTRLITALCLIPIVFWGLFFLHGLSFQLFTGLVVVLGAWEWSSLAGMRDLRGRCVYIAAIGGSLVLLSLLSSVQEWLLLPGVLFWLIAAYWVVRYPQSQGWHTRRSMALIGWWVLVPLWVAMVWLNAVANFASWLVYLLFLVWGADTGAYLAGKRFGKTKLAPQVSPGKTLEGAAGAFLTVSLLAVVFSSLSVLPLSFASLWVLSMPIVLVSILGDLLESMCKRAAGVKDSGKLLPGHGGVLDRIDSLCAALPCYVFAIWTLGWV